MVHIKDNIYLVEVPERSWGYKPMGKILEFYRDYGDGREEPDYIYLKDTFDIAGTVNEYGIEMNGFIHDSELLYLMGVKQIPFYGVKYVVLFIRRADDN